jgi:hypothetical protein
LALQGGVAAPPVVEHLNVVEQVRARFVSRGVTPVMNTLVLQAVEEAVASRDVV